MEELEETVHAIGDNDFFGRQKGRWDEMASADFTPGIQIPKNGIGFLVLFRVHQSLANAQTEGILFRQFIPKPMGFLSDDFFFGLELGEVGG